MKTTIIFLAALYIFSIGVTSSGTEHVLAYGQEPPQQTPYETPIMITYDLHADPFPQEASIDQRRQMYYQWRDNAEWLLDILQPFGSKITFLSAGEFMEFVLEDEANGISVMRRLYESGGSLGTHSHTEHYVSQHNWPSFTYNATEQQSSKSWDNAISFVNAVVAKVIGTNETSAVAAVNNIRGAHLPNDRATLYKFMSEYGFPIHQAGPAEPWVQYFGHYIWNPFRPAAESPWMENLSTPFVYVPSGPVIGKQDVHAGVYQDFSLPNAKKMFLMLYLNWRNYESLLGSDRVWTFGWASHTHDISPNSQTRRDVEEFVNWLNATFIGRRSTSGNIIAKWAGRKEVYEAYTDWEESHRSQSSFNYPKNAKDYSFYPYLKPVQHALEETYYVSEISTFKNQGVYAHHLISTSDGRPIYVLWKDNGKAIVDLSSQMNATAKVTSSVTGNVTICQANAIEVGDEAIVAQGASFENSNLLKNPSFEDDADGNGQPDFWNPWPLPPPSGVGFVWDTVKSKTGSYSAHVESTSPNSFGMWRQLVSVTANAVYVLSGYVGFEGIIPPGRCNLQLVFRNASGGLIRIVDFPSHDGTRELAYDFPPELKIRTPATAVAAEVNLFSRGVGKAWFDDVFFGLAPTGNVSGWVTANGAPLQGAKVSIWGDPWGADYEAFTDSKGRYTLVAVPKAFPRYILLASKSGYKTKPIGDIDVIAGEETIVDFELELGKDPVDDLRVKFGSLARVDYAAVPEIPADATIDVNAYPEYVRPYVLADDYIDSDHPAVQALAAQILESVPLGNRTNTREIAYAVYAWMSKNIEHDGLYSSVPGGLTNEEFRDVTCGIWQTISGEGWSWGHNFYDWAYKPSETLAVEGVICAEHAWLASALLRALGIPARAAVGLNQFWVQRPSGEGMWITMSTTAGRTAYREHGLLGPGFGKTPWPAFFAVANKPLLHEDWYTDNKCMWRERHPWEESYQETSSGLQNAIADLEQFELTGNAPAGTLQQPGTTSYVIHYSDVTVNLYNIGEQRILDVRFPFMSESETHTYAEHYAYWTNHPECVVRTWIENVVNPPVEGEERWLHIEFNLSSLLDTSTDLNSDGRVNIIDINIVAVAFGARSGDQNWNAVADVDKNGKIDIMDIARIAKDFGKVT